MRHLAPRTLCSPNFEPVPSAETLVSQPRGERLCACPQQRPSRPAAGSQSISHPAPWRAGALRACRAPCRRRGWFAAAAGDPPATAHALANARRARRLQAAPLQRCARRVQTRASAARQPACWPPAPRAWPAAGAGAGLLLDPAPHGLHGAALRGAAQRGVADQAGAACDAEPVGAAWRVRATRARCCTPRVRERPVPAA